MLTAGNNTGATGPGTFCSFRNNRICGNRGLQSNLSLIPIFAE